MKEITELLFKLADKDKAEFDAQVVPNLSKEIFLGIRMPTLRKLAKSIKNSALERDFLNELPHHYYDENMLHAVILNYLNDYDKAIEETIKFLPYVNNWATCDTMHSKGLGKNKKDLLQHIKNWIKSEETYTIRFGLNCLMNYFLGEDFKPEYLDFAGSIKSSEYYVNMMIAWYFATALTLNYEDTIYYMESKKLSKWVQNKTIQKAKESYRISSERKGYLETLKIK